jgi:hypothetical protein
MSRVNLPPRLEIPAFAGMTKETTFGAISFFRKNNMRRMP